MKNYRRVQDEYLDVTGKGEVQAATGTAVQSSEPVRPALLNFRPYQRAAFENRTNGIEVWLWGRQTGKSFTLAAWAVDRLILSPGRTVTMLSNSRFNGMELNRRCAEVCDLIGQAFDQVDLSLDNRFETMRAETRIAVHGKVGRILVLPANPLTARSFSGDLILDEFAFHQDGAAIWAAAEPIISSNPNYLCRIASTPNGKHNQFYRLATDPKIPLRRVTRTQAHADGCKVFHPVTREEIDPKTARDLADSKRVYDQNYECAFEDENMALLTHELINAAERPDVGVVCDGEWSAEAMRALTQPGIEGPERGWKPVQKWIREAEDQGRMYRHILMNVCNGSVDRMDMLQQSEEEIRIDEEYKEGAARRPRDGERALYVGVDVGRNNDRTVITVVEKAVNRYLVRGILRLAEMRLPEQQERLEQALKLHAVKGCKIDMTGLGLGLYEYTAKRFAQSVHGVNFASNVAITERLRKEGRTGETAPVTQVLATHLLQAFEDRAIEIPVDMALRDDLRKPERCVSPSGRVLIAATRNEAGHADHFWSLALAIDAAQTPAPKPFEYYSWLPKCRQRVARL